jgi:DNA-binding transcriptional regulator YdaS (Cro superfamily)
VTSMRALPMSLAETHTQSQLARLLGVSQGMISQILSGKRGLTPRISEIITEVRPINNNIAPRPVPTYAGRGLAGSRGTNCSVTWGVPGGVSYE